MAPEVRPSLPTSPSGSIHTHDPAHTKMLLDRLARIEGHVRGIGNMVREDRPCPDVLVQISAVRAALNQVAKLVLKEHLSDCVVHAVENGGAHAEIQALNQAIDRYID
jgi:DNA-binding FrmR family transcriptional regulator